jgi:hypothetical protein
MPIRPEFRHFYRSPEWRAARKRVLARAKNRCEQCGKRDRRRVWVFRAITGRSQYWSSVKGDGQRWHCCVRNGLEIRAFRLRREQWGLARQIRVILAVVHLNHRPGDDRDENLKALCQWCHLNYDKMQHRETRCNRKDRMRPLLALEECA